MKFKTSTLLNTQHTVVARLTFEEDGERKTEEVKVVYRSLSPKTMREVQEAAVVNGEQVDIVKYLAQIVASLPDVIGEDEQPITPSVELFEQMDSDNLKAIFNAIQGDVSPND